MDCVPVRELREKSGEIWQRVDAGEEFVVTRNGKPFALLLHTDGPPARVLADIAASRLRPVVCDAVMAEYEAMLRRPRLRIAVADAP